MNELLHTFVLRQNKFQQTLGHWVAWGTLSMVLLSASIVILRYGFDTGSIALQESMLYNHAILFMLGMAYTLQQNQHVRVDVFYEQMSESRKAWVNFIGSLFLALPTLLFIFYSSWDYVANSWAIQEASAESGGLAFVYLLKTIILIMATLLSLQTLSLAAESWLKTQGYPEDSTEQETEGQL